MKREDAMDYRLDDSLVLAAGTGKAVRMRAGQRLKLTNPFGTQAIDFWAFTQADIYEFTSMDNFRSVHSTVHVTSDTPLVSTKRRPLVSIVEDTSSGRHDTLLCACNADIYRQLGVTGYHRSCADNLHKGLAELGIRFPVTPAPANFFMCVDVRADGSLDRLLPASKPGSYLVLQAEADIIMAFSCCPQDITPINGEDRTPRDCLIDIFSPAGSA
ncbi:urea carboxylase-associated family protein [Ancylobacter sp. SL191]|uniref:urea carboxylase-associated family protein n=1 Tax=Ancylobacter sp. SL191 TaxID=2995166 RepID=UPI002270EB09|nr:urea carboxylase-associated family protein [Ancylobacter sp. SL191]WAC27894.1 urea carboxylase-associated family protein [Ancylobacter sp. SL191]